MFNSVAPSICHLLTTHHPVLFKREAYYVTYKILDSLAADRLSLTTEFYLSVLTGLPRSRMAGPPLPLLRLLHCGINEPKQP